MQVYFKINLSRLVENKRRLLSRKAQGPTPSAPDRVYSLWQSSPKSSDEGCWLLLRTWKSQMKDPWAIRSSQPEGWFCPFFSNPCDVESCDLRGIEQSGPSREFGMDWEGRGLEEEEIEKVRELTFTQQVVRLSDHFSFPFWPLAEDTE